MSNWFTFQGRTNRQPYLLTNLIVGVIIKTVEGFAQGSEFLTMLSLPFFVAAICLVVPVAVRRAHDVGKSGWFVILLFIPILFIWPGLVLAFQKGKDEPNEYGENPLAAAAPAA